MSYVTVKITFEHNENEIEITQRQLAGQGKTNVEDAIRALTDRAKAKAIAAVNA